MGAAYTQLHVVDHENCLQIALTWPYLHHTVFTVTEVKSACTALLSAIVFIHAQQDTHVKTSTAWKTQGKLYTSPSLTWGLKP